MNMIWPHRLTRLAAGVVLAGMLAGCTSKDEPRRYQEPQEKTAESAPDMGAKGPMTPPPGGGPTLVYDTPKGWVSGNVGGMRKAAFVVQDGDRKVEITAIDLSAHAGTLLANVNRWRGQIQLPEITQGELDKSASRIQVADAEGNYVELLGPEGASPRQAILGVVAVRGEQAWFFKLWGDAELALREKARFQEFVKSVSFAAPKSGGSPSVLTQNGSGSPPLKLDAPEGWTPSEARGAGRAAFHVADGDRKVEIAVVELPGSVEKLLPNVNRWRQQVHLDPTTQAELETTLKPIQVAGLEGKYIELVGPEGAKPRLAMLIVLVNRDGKSWLFRMTGDADLALREKERFQGFAKSFKLPTAAKGKNGE
jgi:hypothetical protein